MSLLSNPPARGLVSSLGAGSSLVGAGLVCLIVVSAMLVHRDWPGTDAGRPDGSLPLLAPEGEFAGREASGPLRAGDAPALPASASGAGGETVRARGDRPAGSRRGESRTGLPQDRAPAAPPSAAAPQSEPVAATPSGGGSPGGGGSGGDGSGGGGSDPAPAPAPAPDPAPRAVEQLVGTGRQVVDPITAPLPPVVQQPVTGALDTAEEAGRTVDGVVGELPAGDAVGDVTGALLP